MTPWLDDDTADGDWEQRDWSMDRPEDLKDLLLGWAMGTFIGILFFAMVFARWMAAS